MRVSKENGRPVEHPYSSIFTSTKSIYSTRNMSQDGKMISILFLNTIIKSQSVTLWHNFYNVDIMCFNKWQLLYKFCVEQFRCQNFRIFVNLKKKLFFSGNTFVYPRIFPYFILLCFKSIPVVQRLRFYVLKDTNFIIYQTSKNK